MLGPQLMEKRRLGLLGLVVALLAISSAVGVSNVVQELRRTELASVVIKNELDAQRSNEIKSRESDEERNSGGKAGGKFLSWNELLSGMEALARPEIGLIELSRDRSDGPVVLKAWARDGNALAAYISQLELWATKARVTLARQEALNAGGRAAIYFEMAIEWR